MVKENIHTQREKRNTMELVRYTGPHEWSALYVDGALDVVGDHYLIEERIEVLCGVTVRDSDDFMCGGDDRASVAHSLAEIESYVQTRDRREEDAEAAAELRRQAAELLRQADELAPQEA
jgi:hypothetical protein